MIASPNETVLVNVKDGIATIAINRPESLNALNDDVVTALIEVSSALKVSKDVRCAILTGVGDYFIAGGDVKRFKRRLNEADNEEELEAWFTSILQRIHSVVENFYACPMPIIGAVKGAVAGAGFSLMLGCDLVIASNETVFTLAYCHLGTSPDGGSTWYLMKTVGKMRAMEIALLGDRFGPEQAQSWGLVNSVVSKAKLDEETQKLSERLASGPTYAYKETKRLLLDGAARPLDEQLAAETRSFVTCAMRDDFKRGVTAFVEKQKPAFTGD